MGQLMVASHLGICIAEFYGTKIPSHGHIYQYNLSTVQRASQSNLQVI